MLGLSIPCHYEGREENYLLERTASEGCVSKDALCHVASEAVSFQNCLL